MNILRRIPLWGFVVLLVYMPFHIFLSQSLSLITGGLEVWKVAKDVVLLALVVFTICLILLRRSGGRVFYILLGLAVGYGLLHFLLWALNPSIYRDSAILGIIYNNRLPCFLLLGYGATLLNKDMFAFSSIIKLVIGVTSVVAFLAVLQYLLPKDILTYVGYGIDRGVRPSFFIEDNPALPRVFATLREPNALGAFLIVPIALLTWLATHLQNNKKRIFAIGLAALHAFALLLTFSRSAWLGAAVAVGLVLWWSYKDVCMAFVRRFWPVLGAAVAVGLIGMYLLRETPFVQHYITHTTEEQVEDLDSNDLHTLLVKEGIEGFLQQPLGHGPGTAGLASIQNPDGAKLTENYYVQIAYEIGLVGLLLFLVCNGTVYYYLWKQKTWFSLALLASFWGYVITNMLLHTWSNEAVAAQWWLLAGAALGIGQATKSHRKV